ncbi:MAG: hopanoid-associated sugar epimerase [Verrucomicrobiia bacterium]|jgi:dihydroflavonol-4-reductase
MKCFVTGATGFVGANLCRELLKRGFSVRILLRENSPKTAIEGLNIEYAYGDVVDKNNLENLIRGCDWCFHVAASYHLWMKDYKKMYETNVEGTRNVIEAAANAGCSRIVYTSTVGCIALPKIVDGKLVPSDESAPVFESQMSNHYKLSKFKAEQAAIELAKKGAPVVIVNPSAPVGPYDVKPTPTGRIIVDFLNRKMPAYLDTGLNWVHVRDVAIGHILAAEKGKIGERYILGNAAGNLTMEETFKILEELSGIPAPKIKIPYFIALLFAYLNELVAKVTGIPPKAPIAGVRMAKHKMFFNPQKAINELGLPQTPVRQAFADAIEWFKKNGYVNSNL